MSLIFLVLLFYAEVVEHACGMATLQMGEYVPNVSNGIDTYSLREPLGVCAGICPFNFPAMIPLWVNPIHILLLTLVTSSFSHSIVGFTTFIPHWIIRMLLYVLTVMKQEVENTDLKKIIMIKTCA